MERALPGSCDVLIAGTGAAGLAAAFAAACAGLDVCLIEKDQWIGGTTAFSGGVLWAPGHRVAGRVGTDEDVVTALAYLRAEAGNHLNAPMAERFLKEVPRILDRLVNEAGLDLTAPVYPDYHPALDGWTDQGRTLRPKPFDGRKLGPDIHLVRPPLPTMTILGGMMVSADDMKPLMHAMSSIANALHSANLIGRYAFDRLVHRRATRLTNGNALVGALLHAVLSRGVRPFLGVQLDRLCLQDDTVVGAVVKGPAGPKTVQVRCGVILATGGIGHDAERLGLLASGLAASSLAPKSCSGDGARIARDVGGGIRDQMVSAIAWVPISDVPGKDALSSYPSFFDRSKPGFIIVDGEGKRFVNEALSYHDLGPHVASREKTGVFLIGDGKAVAKYGMGAALPRPFSNAALIRSGYLIRERSIEKLATRIGLPVDNLRLTIETWNEAASQGKDVQFGRGEDAYQRYIGDAAHGPNPSVGPLTEPPFHAIRLRAGFISTFAGLQVDENAQLLRADGRPIVGLHAVGNDMASVMAGTYPGPGVTLAPALVFGMLAAEYLARGDRSARDSV